MQQILGDTRLFVIFALSCQVTTVQNASEYQDLWLKTHNAINDTKIPYKTEFHSYRQEMELQQVEDPRSLLKLGSILSQNTALKALKSANASN